MFGIRIHGGCALAKRFFVDVLRKYRSIGSRQSGPRFRMKCLNHYRLSSVKVNISHPSNDCSSAPTALIYGTGIRPLGAQILLLRVNNASLDKLRVLNHSEIRESFVFCRIEKAKSKMKIANRGWDFRPFCHGHL